MFWLELNFKCLFAGLANLAGILSRTNLGMFLKMLLKFEYVNRCMFVFEKKTVRKQVLTVATLSHGEVSISISGLFYFLTKKKFGSFFDFLLKVKR